MIWGKSSLLTVAKIARESTWEFLPWETYSSVKEWKSLNNRFTQPKYQSILRSFASYSLWTCPTTSLELQYALIILPPSFCIAFRPANKASYFASLFVATNPSLSDFSKVMPSGETITIPIPDPFLFATPSTNNYQVHSVTTIFQMHRPFKSSPHLWVSQFLSKFCHQIC